MLQILSAKFSDFVGALYMKKLIASCKPDGSCEKDLKMVAFVNVILGGNNGKK